MKILKKIRPIVFPVLLFLILLQNSVFAAQIKAKFKVDGIT